MRALRKPPFSLQQAWPALVPPLTALLASLLLWLNLAPAEVMHVIVEGGPVERLTEWGYMALAAAMWLSPPPPGERRGWLALTVLLLAAAAREMDWHKHWTGTSVFKVSYYLHPGPLLPKLIALAILALIVLAAWHWLRQPLQAWLGPVAQVFFAMLIISKVLDRAINLLAEDWGVHTSEGIHALVSALEETLELSLPLIAAYGLWCYARRWRARPAALAAR